jgi:hypothetical protein
MALVGTPNLVSQNLLAQIVLLLMMGNFFHLSLLLKYLFGWFLYVVQLMFLALIRGYERPLQPVPGDCGYHLHAHWLVLCHPTTNKVKYVSRLEQCYLLYGLCNTTSRTKQSTYAEI